MLDKFLSAHKLNMDKKGYFMMKVDHDRGVVRARYHSCIKNENGEICNVRGKKISCSGDNRPEPMIAFEAPRSSLWRYLRDGSTRESW